MMVLYVRYICMMVLYVSYIWPFSFLIKLSGDVEENRCPKSKSSQSFSKLWAVFLPIVSVVKFSF